MNFRFGWKKVTASILISILISAPFIFTKRMCQGFWDCNYPFFILFIFFIIIYVIWSIAEKKK